MTPVSQEEFDALAIFIAVARELGNEPFFSEDNHETICTFDNGDLAAFFCHPAFLKSAVLPFRKFWLDSEPCAFKSIRNLVFRTHPDTNYANGYRPWFYDIYERRLAEIVCDQQNLTVKDVIEMWLYTHAVHAGPKELGKKGSSKTHRTLQEFDRWVKILGREQFEYQFRLHLLLVGSDYISFATHLAQPVYNKLRSEWGLSPGFEAEASMAYSPYPDPRFRITFDDPFWHLNKESIEETFVRLLARQAFDSLRRLFVAFFPTRASALAALCEFSTLESLFVGVGGSLLKDGEVPTGLLRSSGGGGFSTGSVGFEAYEDRKLRIATTEHVKLASHYSAFRKTLFEERKRQGKRSRWAIESRWD